MTIDEILNIPDVKERIEVYNDQTLKFKEMIIKYTSTKGNVIISDLRGVDPIYTGNRFLIYSLYPEQNVSVWIVSGKGGQGCSCATGYSILNKTCHVDVGALMLKYGANSCAGVSGVTGGKSAGSNRSPAASRHRFMKNRQYFFAPSMMTPVMRAGMFFRCSAQSQAWSPLIVSSITSNTISEPNTSLNHGAGVMLVSSAVCCCSCSSNFSLICSSRGSVRFSASTAVSRYLLV